jgi:hypothetical protein
MKSTSHTIAVRPAIDPAVIMNRDNCSARLNDLLGIRAQCGRPYDFPGLIRFSSSHLRERKPFRAES